MMPMGLYSDDQENGSNYVRFGRIILQGKPLPKNAVKAGREWINTGDPVYAVEIPNEGWSRTNMMYCKKFKRNGVTYQRALLAYEGAVYTASWRCAK